MGVRAKGEEQVVACGYVVIVKGTKRWSGRNPDTSHGGVEPRAPNMLAMGFPIEISGSHVETCSPRGLQRLMTRVSVSYHKLYVFRASIQLSFFLPTSPSLSLIQFLLPILCRSRKIRWNRYLSRLIFSCDLSYRSSRGTTNICNAREYDSDFAISNEWILWTSNFSKRNE